MDRAEYFKLIKDRPVPADALPVYSGDSLSLSHFRGSPLLLVLTIPNCGPCKASYPTVCKLLDEYSSSGLKGVGVFYAEGVNPKSLAGYSKAHSLNFPLMADADGHIHKYFTQTGAAPMYCIIDKDGVLHDYVMGFDAFIVDKSENKLRRMIERWLE